MNEIIIENINNPIRLDRFLRSKFIYMTQGFIEKSLRLGNIKLNSKKAQASERLVNGDNIQIYINIEHFTGESGGRNNNPAVIQLAEDLFGKYKIFEDDNILVINKPTLLAVQGGTKVKLSVDDALQYLNFEGSEYKLTHRLDKETSGLLVIAKNRDAAQNMAKGFSERLIQKKYIAVVSPKPNENEGEIRSCLEKSADSQKIEESPTGRLAITNYRVLKAQKDRALIEFIPLTGRMHQLRYHAKQIGCPIIGDSKYGVSDGNLLLHAKEIYIPAELFGKDYRFEAPLLREFYS